MPREWFSGARKAARHGLTTFLHLNIHPYRSRSLPQQGWSNMSALQLINVSDNSLTSLPEDIGSCPRLDTLLCYGNGIQSLPAASLAAAPKLRYIWAESNPLAPGEADRLVASLAARGEEAAPRVRTLSSLCLLWLGVGVIIAMRNLARFLLEVGPRPLLNGLYDK